MNETAFCIWERLAVHSEAPLFSLANRRFNVIVLAAGLGTRLRPATDYLPKALVEIGPGRAIDHVIQKYQFISDRIILAVGYCADLLENYCRGKYSSLSLSFSRESPAELRGPGNSLVYALDHASCRLPTIVTFCDYLVGDQFPVDYDGLGVCSPTSENAVLDSYKTIAVVRDGFVTNIMPNPDPERSRENGFTGIVIAQDTTLLKSIAYHAASTNGDGAEVDYALEIVRPYILKKRAHVRLLSRIVEFGTEETLTKARDYLNGNRGTPPK